MRSVHSSLCYTRILESVDLSVSDPKSRMEGRSKVKIGRREDKTRVTRDPHYYSSKGQALVVEILAPHSLCVGSQLIAASDVCSETVEGGARICRAVVHCDSKTVKRALTIFFIVYIASSFLRWSCSHRLQLNPCTGRCCRSYNENKMAHFLDTGVNIS